MVRVSAAHKTTWKTNSVKSLNRDRQALKQKITFSSVMRNTSQTLSQLEDEVETWLIETAKSFHCDGLEHVVWWQKRVFVSFASIGNLSYSWCHLWWCSDVRCRHGVDNSHVPNDWLTAEPRYQSHTVRPFAVRSWKTSWFFDGGNASFGKWSPYDIIQSLMTYHSSRGFLAAEAVVAVSVHRGTALARVWLA